MMARGSLVLVSLTLLLLARSCFCKSMPKEQPDNSTILPQPKAAVTADECSSDPSTITINVGDYANFSTPNYPNRYPRFHKCSWKYQVGANAKLTLNCPVVHLGWRSSLFVNDGGNTTRIRCNLRECSPRTFEHEFVSSLAKIRLVTRRVTRPGFTCKITAVSTDTGITTAPESGNCNCGVSVRSLRIVGGVETQEHEYPWMALMVTRSGDHPFCGGSVINNKFILTAAHCTRKIAASEVRVRLGLHKSVTPYPDSALSRDAIEFIVHPHYKVASNNNDVALIKIEPIDFSIVGPNIRPICLPSGNSLYEGETATVAGWGHTTEGGTASDHLREVDVPVITNSLCNNFFPVTSEMICAGNGGKDSCQGDSGGPLFTKSSNGKYVDQIGVVSWGIGCGREYYPGEYYPGVYARITALWTWILTNSIGSITCAPPS